MFKNKLLSVSWNCQEFFPRYSTPTTFLKSFDIVTPLTSDSQPLHYLCANERSLYLIVLLDPPIWHEGEDDDDDASDGWDEMEVTGEQTTCLFCPSQFLTIAVALDHCRTEHNFDLSQLKTKYSMDCYSFLKMVNYVRLHRPDAKTVAESGASLWEDEVYLKPGEMESWLMYGKFW